MNKNNNLLYNKGFIAKMFKEEEFHEEEEQESE